MKRTTLISLIVVTVLAMVFATAMGPRPKNASVYVIHGINGMDLGLESSALPVDILVNDALCALQGFEYKTIAGPLTLSEGTYNIKISLANAENPCSNDAVISADVPFARGENATVIAHLDGNGAPTASKFTNKVVPIKPTKARLTVRHTAVAPEVDVKLEFNYKGKDREYKFLGLSNGETSRSQNLPAGDFMASLLPAGGRDPVVGPMSLTLNGKTAYFVYAVGTFPSTFDLIIHTIDLSSGY